ncbi:MAG: EpsI family protein [Deltaproteobacteria bacterium]|nr:EpsI family protein [Deltaproteobacteria bacterium]
MKNSSWATVIIISLLLFATWGYTKNFSHVPEIPLKRPLSKLPMVLDKFHGRTLTLSDDIYRILRPTDMLFREYVTDSGEKVEVYVSYHSKQTSEFHPHSPRICMPASGWLQSGTEQKSISLADGKVIRTARAEYVKGLNRILFLYWYQTGGRFMANEYLQKFSMIADAMFRRRTDVAFVRVSTTVEGKGVTVAERRLENFVKIFVPTLDQVLPE